MNVAHVVLIYPPCSFFVRPCSRSPVFHSIMSSCVFSPRVFLNLLVGLTVYVSVLSFCFVLSFTPCFDSLLDFFGCILNLFFELPHLDYFLLDLFSPELPSRPLLSVLFYNFVFRLQSVFFIFYFLFF